MDKYVPICNEYVRTYHIKTNTYIFAISTYVLTKYVPVSSEYVSTCNKYERTYHKRTNTYQFATNTYVLTI